MELAFQDLKAFLDFKVAQYNRPNFIENDPIKIPHSFSKPQDIEIMGLFAAILAWGNRSVIIRNCEKIAACFENEPHDFILNHSKKDLKKMNDFVHRTFNFVDLHYFIRFMNAWYKKHDSLEMAFTKGIKGLAQRPIAMENYLVNFHYNFFSLDDFPQRTLKHIANPLKGSTCKRLNMYLRWMVRKDNAGVDFGLWNQIKMNELICPIDVHVERVAKKLSLLENKSLNWKMALELTRQLSLLDPKDPVKYDFALFGLGVEEKF